MATEVFNIIVNARGARTVRRDIRTIGREADRSVRRVAGLTRAIGTLSAALGTRRVFEFASQFQNLQNRIRLFSDSQEGANEQINALVNIANRARQSLDDVGVVYQRLAINQDKLGVSGERLNGVIETIAKSIAVGGSNAQESRGALRQFGQALSGDFQRSAQELNSVIEQTPGLANALTRGLEEIGVASNITTADLKRLTQEGILNTATAIRALESQADDIDIAFAKIAPTFSQTAQRINNSLTVLSGRFFEVTGLGAKLTEILNKAANATLELANDTDRFNEAIDTTVDVLQVLLGIGAVRFFARLGAAITFAGNATKALVGSGAGRFLARFARQAGFAAAALRLLSLTNPLGLLITGVTTAIAFLVSFRDELLNVNGEQVALRDVVAGAWDVITEKIGEGFDAVRKFFTELTAGLNARRVFNELIRVAVAFGRAFKLVFERALDQVFGFVTGVSRLIGALPEAVKIAATQGFEAAGAFLGQKFSEGFVDNLTTIPEEIDRINRELADTDFVGDALTGIGDVLSGTEFGDAAIAARDRRLRGESPAEDAPGVRTPPPDEGGLQLTGQALEKRLKAFRDLEEQLDPLIALTREYTEAQKQLDIALQVGAIDTEEYNRLQGLLIEQTRDAALETREFQETLSSTDSVLEGAKAGFRDFRESLGTEFSIIREGISGAFDQGLDAITEFARTGEFNLRGFAQSAIALIQKVIIKLLVLKAIQAITGTGGAAGAAGGGGTVGLLAGLLGGGAAPAGAQSGGDLRAGETRVVGERGAELFTAPRAGTITPNDQISGGGPSFTIVNVLDPASIPAAMSGQAGEEVIINMIQANRTAVRQVIA